MLCIGITLSFLTVRWIEEKQNNKKVNIPDKNLESLIREEIGKMNGPLYVRDLKKITRLDMDNRYIENLEGLQYCVNLVYLVQHCGGITDLSPLSNLSKLEHLNLGVNPVSDISPLSTLKNLTYLSIYQSNVSDLSPLSELTSLEKLDLKHNKISDISPLSNLTNLTELEIGGNYVSDIAPLKYLSDLKWLDISDNKISDISSLSNLTNLEFLLVSKNNISDIFPLTSLINLRELNLAENNISDISPLIELSEKMKNMLIVDIRENPIDSRSLKELEKRVELRETAPESPIPILSSTPPSTETYFSTTPLPSHEYHRFIYLGIIGVSVVLILIVHINRKK